MSILTKDTEAEKYAEKLDTAATKSDELKRILDETSSPETNQSIVSNNGLSTASIEDDIVYSLNMDDPSIMLWIWQPRTSGFMDMS